MSEVENEYNRIQREVQQTEGYTTDRIKGYNEFTSVEDIDDTNVKVDRAAKFNKTKELLLIEDESVEIALQTLKELERIARTEVDTNGNPLTFEAALKLSQTNVRSLVKNNLQKEFTEFKKVIGQKETNAIQQVDKRITKKLVTAEGTSNTNTERSMTLLNLEIDNPNDHNLKQIFYSDYLNRLSVKQILLGDVSMGIKDAVDEIKRMKALNAAGVSAESVIAAPELGVMHPTKNISLITITDLETPPKYGSKGKEGNPVTESDAQMWGTIKAFRHTMFGFGMLNSSQANILDRIEAGEDISIDEFYGSGITKQGYKSLNAIINSQKLVYFDGEVFLKMSNVVLTKQLTSDPQTNFQTALPGREYMHNLRLKLEKIEQDGEETIAFAVPESASKMVKRNVINYQRAFDSNTELNPEDISSLDARWMRLQQINPSNKEVIIDPTQIKQIITSEQDNNVEVMFAGKMTSIGKIREIYNNAVSNRVEIKYLDRRNLIFDFKKGQDELQESINEGQVTPDLYAFLQYAKDGLTASGARSQFLELFEVDEAGKQSYYN